MCIYIYTLKCIQIDISIYIYMCVYACMHARMNSRPMDQYIYIYRHADHASSADQPAKSAYSFEVANFVGSSFPFPLDLVAVSCCSFVGPE